MHHRSRHCYLRMASACRSCHHCDGHRASASQPEVDLLAFGEEPSKTLRNTGDQLARVVDAVEISNDSRQWVTIAPVDGTTAAIR